MLGLEKRHYVPNSTLCVFLLSSMNREKVHVVFQLLPKLLDGVVQKAKKYVATHHKKEGAARPFLLIYGKDPIFINEEGNVMTARGDIYKRFAIGPGGQIKDPGKFHGEMLYVPYYWELYLDGFAHNKQDDGTVTIN